MITEYATDMSSWLEWQQAYRFGVLLIFPPEPVFSQVNALRSRYDPRAQATCAAHISLTVPLPRPIDERRWRELRSIAAGVGQFCIEYGPLMNYLPHPGVCLAIEPQHTLDRLRADLEAASVFAGASLRPYPFSAHMTIAEFISGKRTETLMLELADVTPQGVFTCASVSYAVPDGAFCFTERAQLMLLQ